MNFTSTSDDLILKADQLNLVYRIALQRRASWRDMFAQLSKDPLDVIAPAKERLWVLQNLSFEIRRGERVGLVGVNGAGKTSLCRLVTGMYAPTSGTVSVTSPMRAIFDTQIGIQPELTGRENARLLGTFMYPSLDHRQLGGLIDEALEFSELGHFVDVPYRVYSRGMQARLYLSLVSARPTGLLILDEVFDGADAFFRAKIESRIIDVMNKSGAVFFVSHSADQIVKTCTRALVLHQGNIAFDGSPAEAVKQYEILGQQKRAI